MRNQQPAEPLSPWFVLIAAVFITALITANIVAVKLIDVGGLIVPAGTLTIFPLSYMFGDLLTEVYGFRRARLVIWLGFGCNLLAILAICLLAQVLPPAASNPLGRWVSPARLRMRRVV